jgi:hypothetical protein
MKVSADGTQKFKFTSANRCRVDAKLDSSACRDHSLSAGALWQVQFQAGRKVFPMKSATRRFTKQKNNKEKKGNCCLRLSDNKDDFWSPSGTHFRSFQRRIRFWLMMWCKGILNVLCKFSTKLCVFLQRMVKEVSSKEIRQQGGG